MLRFLASSLLAVFAVSQMTPSPPPLTPPLRFTDSTLFPIVGNYTMGYVNNTVENRCHRGIAKFQAQNTGIVDMLKMGIYSQAAPETCGISFVLSTFPGNGAAVVVGSSLLTTFADLVAATPGTDEFVKFNASASGWSVVAGANYTVTILPFTWASGPAGSTGSTTHCVFQMPYGRPGIPYAAIGQAGPTGLPCGSTPWTTDLAGDGWALQILLNGHPAQVTVPSVSSTVTPTPTSTQTPTPSQTGTPTPSHTPTSTPTITDTPTVTPAPGSTPSNSATQTRTPSRTPSISYTPTPTSSVTSSVTPTETPTPTPSLRIGASPSVTPTETPGPTDSASPTKSPMSHIDALAAGAAATPPAQTSTGSIVGAALGGALVVVVALVVAIRLRIVSAEINGPQRAMSWRKTGKRSSFAVHTNQPEMDINLNQTVMNPTVLVVRSERVKAAGV